MDLTFLYDFPSMSPTLYRMKALANNGIIA